MLKKAILFSIILLFTMPVRASEDAKKAHEYIAAYNECMGLTRCVYESNPYGHNGAQFDKCKKRCEKFALNHYMSSKLNSRKK